MATVLIHLNIDVESDLTDEATEQARDYLRRHNIRVDDVAGIDVL